MNILDDPFNSFSLPYNAFVDDDDRKMIDWYRRYGAALLRGILSWDETRVEAWARRFERISWGWILHESETDHVIHAFIPKTLWARLTQMEQTQLKCRLRDAIWGPDRPDYAEGADVSDAARRIEEVLSSYAESIEHLRVKN